MKNAKKTRKKWKKKVALLGTLICAVLALLYAQCADGFGFGDGKNDGEHQAAVVAPDENEAMTPCEIRVSSAGTTVDGKECATEALTQCCKSKAATLIVTGDARQGDADEVKEALARLGFEVNERLLKDSTTPAEQKKPEN